MKAPTLFKLLLLATGLTTNCKQKSDIDSFSMSEARFDKLRDQLDAHADFVGMIGLKGIGPYKQEMGMSGGLGTTFKYHGLAYTVPPPPPGHYDFMPFLDKSGNAFALIYKIHPSQAEQNATSDHR